MVRGVVTIAKAYGLSTVAEGIETAQQAQALREVGCTFLQGYFYGRPAALPILAALGTQSLFGLKNDRGTGVR